MKLLKKIQPVRQRESVRIRENNDTLLNQGNVLAVKIEEKTKELNKANYELDLFKERYLAEFEAFKAGIKTAKDSFLRELKSLESRKTSVLAGLDQLEEKIRAEKKNFADLVTLALGELSSKTAGLSGLYEKILSASDVARKSTEAIEKASGFLAELLAKGELIIADQKQMELRLNNDIKTILVSVKEAQDQLQRREKSVKDMERANKVLWESFQKEKEDLKSERAKLLDQTKALRLDYDYLRKKNLI